MKKETVQSITIEGVKVTRDNKGVLILEVPTSMNGEELTAFRNRYREELTSFKEGKGFNNFTIKGLSNVSVAGVVKEDFPELTDAKIVSAYFNGLPLSLRQLESLNENEEIVNHFALESLQ